MQSVLLDAGALVAILNRNDRRHADLIELLEGFEGRLYRLPDRSRFKVNPSP